MASDIDSVVTVTDSDDDDDLEIVSVQPKSSAGNNVCLHVGSGKSDRQQIHPRNRDETSKNL